MRTSIFSALTAASLIVALSSSARAQEAVPKASSPTTVAMATAKARLDLDTPIAVIAADPGGRAVLDKDLPGLTDHPLYESFKNDTLRQFQPKTGGGVSRESLALTEKDLAALDKPQN